MKMLVQDALEYQMHTSNICKIFILDSIVKLFTPQCSNIDNNIANIKLRILQKILLEIKKIFNLITKEIDVAHKGIIAITNDTKEKLLNIFKRKK